MYYHGFHFNMSSKYATCKKKWAIICPYVHNKQCSNVYIGGNKAISLGHTSADHKILTLVHTNLYYRIV